MTEQSDIGKPARFSSGEFIGMIVIFACFGGVIVAIPELMRLVGGDSLALVMYGAAFGFVLFVMFGWLVTEASRLEQIIRKEGGETEFAGVLVGCLLSAILFGLFTRELTLTAGAGFGFRDVGRQEWLYFGVDNLLEAICFDIPSIYELHASSIRPTNFATRTLVLFFRLAIDLILIRALLKHWDVLKSVRKITRSVPPAAT